MDFKTIMKDDCPADLTSQTKDSDCTPSTIRTTETEQLKPDLDRTKKPAVVRPWEGTDKSSREGQSEGQLAGLSLRLEQQSVVTILGRELDLIQREHPQHAAWAQGVHAWYQFESQHLHTQFAYVLSMSPRSQQAELGRSHAAMLLMLANHALLLLHSRLRHAPSVTPASRVVRKPSEDVKVVATNNKRSLPFKAVELMSQWYQANFSHPYPDNETIEHFARAGGITVGQVKKWMANKRVRSLNTLSYNRSVHPKRLRRIMQQQRPDIP